MNKFVLITLILALVLSGCTATVPQITSAPEPVQTEAPTPSPAPSPELSPIPTPEPTPTPTPESYEGELVAEYALQFAGGKYSYGGTDPSTGFDCSGLVYYVFRQFGYRLSRVAEDQAKNGEAVESIENLLPGDVLCFSHNGSGYIGHAGIYIGNGKFVHAMDSANGILVSDLEAYLETRSLHARRIIGCVEKLSEDEIITADRRDREILEAAMKAQREAEAAAEAAKAAETPPPQYLPDPASSSENEDAHQQEIEEAWDDILNGPDYNYM